MGARRTKIRTLRIPYEFFILSLRCLLALVVASLDGGCVELFGYVTNFHLACLHCPHRWLHASSHDSSSIEGTGPGGGGASQAQLNISTAVINASLPPLIRADVFPVVEFHHWWLGCFISRIRIFSIIRLLSQIKILLLSDSWIISLWISPPLLHDYSPIQESAINRCQHYACMHFLFPALRHSGQKLNPFCCAIVRYGWLVCDCTWNSIFQRAR